MDELIKKYAAKLKSAKVGDYTYEGILAEFARDVLKQTQRDILTAEYSRSRPF